MEKIEKDPFDEVPKEVWEEMQKSMDEDHKTLLKMEKIQTQDCWLKSENTQSFGIGDVIISWELQKHTDKFILSKEELESIISEAMGAAYAMGIMKDTVEYARELSQTYINNLFK